MNKKTCGTCQHHDPCPWYGFGYCMREDSSYFQEETQDTAYCSAWEPQESDQDEATEE